MRGKCDSLCQKKTTFNEITLVSLNLCCFSEFHGITCSHVNFLSRQQNIESKKHKEVISTY